MAKVIKLRFDDYCRECGAKLPAGTDAQYGGKGAISCVGCRPLANVRTRYGSSVRGGHAATGRRCIDAPCCGCCD
jgi:hypothetical protein